MTKPHQCHSHKEKSPEEIKQEIDRLLSRGYNSGNAIFQAMQNYKRGLHTPKEKEYFQEYIDKISGRESILEKEASRYATQPSGKAKLAPGEYTLEIQWPVPNDSRPEDENVDVNVTFNNGDRYYALFMTPRSLQWIFDKNARTGECLSGTWFGASPNPVFVRKIEESLIRNTIDDLIRNDEFNYHFKRFHEEE